MMKNMPASALDNPFAKQQKVLLYAMPLLFAVSGVNFPIGVLLYWFTTNVWSMVQQFYVIRRMPAPGSEAEKALHARLVKRGKPVPTAETSKAAAAAGAASGADGEATSAGEEPVKTSGQRQQPKGKKRAKGKGGSGVAGAGGSGGGAGGGAASPIREDRPRTDNGPTSS
jgi:YidC/Oxa1 family membrane protein insertase